MHKCCANCYHFLPADKKSPVDPLQGNCLFNPPQVISFIEGPAVAGAPAQLRVMSVFPSIPGNNRPCGQHRPITEEGAANAA